MGLLEDAKKIFSEALGPEVAKQLDDFEDPDKYPDSFLEECEFFLEKLIGKQAAKNKLRTMFDKYSTKSSSTKATVRRAHVRTNSKQVLCGFRSSGISVCCT